MDFTLEIGGNEVKARTSVWTLVVYEMEFSTEKQNADMLQDFFGKGKSGDGEGEVVLDFTKKNWTAIAKCAWACIKTADESTKPFIVWSKDVDSISMFEASEKIANACVDSFFRFRVGEPESQPEAEEEERAAS